MIKKEKTAKERLADFLQSNEREISKFTYWMSMKEEDRKKATKAWDEYYDLVKTGEGYALYFEMEKAVREKNYEKIAEIKNQAKNLLFTGNFMTKPKEQDPYVFLNSTTVSAYKVLLNDAKREEMRQIYGT